ncbi:MAG: hypothetical protein AB8B99_20545 [Phormidesmis sp.]
MTTLSNAQHIALYNQHSLDSVDWQLICRLANVEKGSEKQAHQLASLSLEQFFGLAVHTFISTENYAVRKQLAQLLPKFGARAVLSLLKILFHCKSEFSSASIINAHELSVLAQSSLAQIEPAAFVVGLESVLSDKNAVALMPLVMDTLVSAIRKDDGTILTLLPRLLSADGWKQIKTNLLNLPTFSAIQANVQTQQRRDALTQAMMNANVGITNDCLSYLSCSLVDAPSV